MFKIKINIMKSKSMYNIVQLYYENVLFNNTKKRVLTGRYLR